MLKSRFTKEKHEFKANKIFTDRIAPRIVFANSVDVIQNENNEELQKRIIVFYGKGGIGKTSLLKELYYTYSHEVYRKYSIKEFHNIYISLEAHDFTNPINVLSSIRSHVLGDCI